MVLKSFINYLINKYLKKYVERLDYEKVKLSLKSGKIFLENLRLKPEALANLNIPVTIAVGYLEQLRVSIPWNSLSANPTEIHIDGLYMLIVPKNEKGQDLSEHYTEKSKRVQQKLENFRKVASENGGFDNKELAFIERMRFQVMRNIILTIRNVHISYEMKSSNKLGHPFSFGITFYYLEVTTATNNQLTKRTKEDTLLTYKINEMSSWSVYWNTKCKSRLDMPFKDILDDLKSKIATNNSTPDDNEMKYVIRPSNLLSESLIILKPKQHHYERSTLIFNINIPKMNFHLDSEQISDILDFIKVQDYMKTYDRCYEYRQLLLQDLLAIEPLTQQQKQRIQFLESKLDIFNLAYIRHKVEIESNRLSSTMANDNSDQIQQTTTNQMPINIPNQNTKRDRFQHRLSSLAKVKTTFTHLTKSNRQTKTTTGTLSNILNERESLFEDLPKIDADININQINFNILSTTTNTRLMANRINHEIIACISITEAWFKIKKMSITSRLEFMNEFQSLHIFGTNRDNQYRPILIKPRLLSSPFLHIEFELYTADSKSDNRFYLTMEPIEFIYDAPTINQLMECFDTNDNIIWKAAPKLIQHTIMEMEDKLLSKKILDMNIDLKGVSILLPECGVYQEGFSIIHIHCGNIILKSCLEKSDNDDIDKSLFKENSEEQEFYLKHKFELSDLRISYSRSNKKRLHILRRTPLIDINFYKCIYSNDAILTSWRIGAKIVMGDIQLSKTTLMKLIHHLKSLPLIYSNMSLIIKRANFYFALFSPYATLTNDLSIYNCCLRLLRYSQTSIRTDLDIYLKKTRDENSTNLYGSIMLNEPTMTQRLLSEINQSSRSFYQRKHLQLVYDDSSTKL
ncbi:unnamed protein product [Rotaria sordida]|uniref:Chorein N-terminal domain-containing protein n=2 Tax=Rotaria sordida TaxID=392033 RepID=A0A813XQT2_9BILA|nr:unnamed protein product [Rotaria sordida]